MSRKIDTSDLGSLSQEDLLYLNDRGRLTPEDRKRYLSEEPSEPKAEEPENTGDVGGSSEQQGDGETNGDGTPEDDYEEWSKQDLVDECETRDLPKGGNMAELIERLRANDREEG